MLAGLAVLARLAVLAVLAALAGLAGLAVLADPNPYGFDEVEPFFTGAPKAAIRHPFEVLTSSTGRRDAVWPVAPVSVMAAALDPCTVIRPTASVGWRSLEKKI